jgi:hypothetical protein
MIDHSAINPDHERIWLQQKCCGDHEFDGRQWAEDQVWEECDCQNPSQPTEYIRADRYYQLVMEVARKFEGETRHETALRYIREREAASVDTHPKGEDAKQASFMGSGGAVRQWPIISMTYSTTKGWGG